MRERTEPREQKKKKEQQKYKTSRVRSQQTHYSTGNTPHPKQISRTNENIYFSQNRTTHSSSVSTERACGKRCSANLNIHSSTLPGESNVKSKHQIQSNKENTHSTQRGRNKTRRVRSQLTQETPHPDTISNITRQQRCDHTTTPR